MIKYPFSLFIVTLTMLLFFNCSHEKYGVYLDELPAPPILTKENGMIQLHIDNSIRHSARSIYKIETTRRNTIIQIRAYQKLSGLPFTKYRNDFTIDLKTFHFDPNTSIGISWVDPNGTETLLTTYSL